MENRTEVYYFNGSEGNRMFANQDGNVSYDRAGQVAVGSDMTPPKTRVLALLEKGQEQYWGNRETLTSCAKRNHLGIVK